MFTGIVTDIGRVRRIQRNGDTRLEITTGYDTAEIVMGASICCSGVCLTAIDMGLDWFAVQASAETLARTTLGSWKEDTRINLERALKAGDELGGHIVTGHVDGVARVADRAPEGQSVRLRFRVPAAIARYIAAKGSVALDGVSLTVNDVADEGPKGAVFGVNIIPHTQQATTLGGLKTGDGVNLEIDPLARYVARLLDRE